MKNLILLTTTLMAALALLLSGAWILENICDGIRPHTTVFFLSLIWLLLFTISNKDTTEV